MELGVAPATPALLAGMLALAAGGAPHCAAMCGAPCSPWIAERSWPHAAAFLAARLVGYAVVGALLAGGATQLAQSALTSRLAQPLWLAWHLLALAWGLWMLVRAEQPLLRLARPALSPPGVSAVADWQAVSFPAGRLNQSLGLACTAGLAWVAWPCGLLHSALLMSSLADGAAGGAALMALFALVTSVGLGLAPALWRRWATRQRALARLAGGALVAATTWGLAQQTGLVAWCLSRM